MNRAEFATVRAYAAALGSGIELVTRFDDERITIG